MFVQIFRKQSLISDTGIKMTVCQGFFLIQPTMKILTLHTKAATHALHCLLREKIMGKKREFAPNWNMEDSEKTCLALD